MPSVEVESSASCITKRVPKRLVTYVPKWGGMGLLSALFYRLFIERSIAEWLQDALQISCDYRPLQRGGLAVVVAGSGLPHKAIRRIGRGVPDVSPFLPP